MFQCEYLGWVGDGEFENLLESNLKEQKAGLEPSTAAEKILSLDILQLVINYWFEKKSRKYVGSSILSSPIALNENAPYQS